MKTTTVTVTDQTLQARIYDGFLDGRRQALAAAFTERPESASFRYTLDLAELQKADADLLASLLTGPHTFLSQFRNALHRVLSEEWGAETQGVSIDVVTIGLHQDGFDPIREPRLRAIGHAHLGRLIQPKAVVKAVRDPKVRALEAAWECLRCTTVTTIPVLGESLEKPPSCQICETVTPWRLIEDQCRWTDHQLAKVQELQDHVIHGRQPRPMLLHLRPPFIDVLRPGDQVRITGTVKLENVRRNNAPSVDFESSLQAEGVEVLDSIYMDVALDAEAIEEARRLVDRPDYKDFLLERIFGLIKGHDNCKEGLLLALFGGVAIERRDGTRERGDVHVLLVGDPGIAKSALLMLAGRAAPRCVHATGEASTEAGLIAAARHDPLLQEWVIEPGALGLADKAIICLDELDKFKGELGVLHSALERQVTSVSKAGITVDIASRCGALMAANPKLGRFDEYEALHTQVDIPPSILSRCDLIYVIRDVPGEGDAAVVQALLDRYRYDAARDKEASDELGLIRTLIAFARTYVEPVIPPSLDAYIQKWYVGMRSLETGGFPITARQAAAMIRLTQAHARMHLRQEATRDDFEAAKRILMEAWTTVGVDSDTGALDLGAIETGITKSQHDRLRAVQDVVRHLSNESPHGFAREEEVVEACMQQAIAPEDTRKALDALRRNNTVYARGGTGTYALLGR